MAVGTPGQIVVDLGDCFIESYNPEILEPESEARGVADSLVNKKVRDVILSETGIDIEDRKLPTRVVKLAHEYIVIPDSATVVFTIKKEE